MISIAVFLILIIYSSVFCVCEIFAMRLTFAAFCSIYMPQAQLCVFSISAAECGGVSASITLSRACSGARGLQSGGGSTKIPRKAEGQGFPKSSWKTMERFDRARFQEGCGWRT